MPNRITLQQVMAVCAVLALGIVCWHPSEKLFDGRSITTSEIERIIHENVPDGTTLSQAQQWLESTNTRCNLFNFPPKSKTFVLSFTAGAYHPSLGEKVFHSLSRHHEPFLGEERWFVLLFFDKSNKFTGDICIDNAHENMRCAY